MIEKGIKKDDAIFNVLRDYIKASSRILFEGDGYSDDWVREAEKRGLSNLRTTPEALDVLVSEETERLFAETGVMKKSEVEARYEIELEKYQKTIQIEARVMGDIATTSFRRPSLTRTACWKTCGVCARSSARNTWRTLIRR